MISLSGWLPCPSFPHRRRSFVGSLPVRELSLFVINVSHQLNQPRFKTRHTLSLFDSGSESELSLLAASLCILCWFSAAEEVIFALLALRFDLFCYSDGEYHFDQRHTLMLTFLRFCGIVFSSSDSTTDTSSGVELLLSNSLLGWGAGSSSAGPWCQSKWVWVATSSDG